MPRGLENGMNTIDIDTLQRLKDWADFFREIGLGDFYVRSQEITPAASPDGPVASGGIAPRDEPQAVREPAAAPRAEAPARPPSMQLQRQTARQTLSLFEQRAPEAARMDETLEAIRADLGDCRRCKLWSGRKHIVFGQGSAQAKLVLVGEGPGADEDEQGLPFVGRAGQLLNKMLKLIQLPREEVYICNVVKCRPPGNRTPESEEIAACSPFLLRQIGAIRPRLICCLGAPATRTVLGLKEGITRIHGRFYDYGNIKAMATVHPAYVLRSPREEVILREDFEKIRDFLKQTSD